MLVLSRKANQSIMIGDAIEIQVVDIKGDQVKIGINAPRTVTIYRKEVYQDIQKENINAVKSTSVSALSKLLKRKDHPDSH